MRKTFARELLARAKQDSRVILVVGDLGYSVVDDFQKELPKQFINAGVAEQNMTGVAAGLALSGKQVFTYSIANFPTIRCLEQVRNDICYHNANVTIVSVGSGFAYGAHGYTHHGIEDITLMRALPNMKVFCPADAIETQWTLDQIFKLSGPCYLRLHKDNQHVMHGQDIHLPFPSMLPLLQGFKKTILATGNVTHALFNTISHEKWPCNLWSIPIIKPLDKTTLLKIFQDSTLVITVEEHQLVGGFGSAILEGAEELVKDGRLSTMPKILRLGVEDKIYRSMSSEIYFERHLVQTLKKLL